MVDCFSVYRDEVSGCRVAWFLISVSKALVKYLKPKVSECAFFFLSDDNTLLFNLHLIPSGCCTPFFFRYALDNPITIDKTRMARIMVLIEHPIQFSVNLFGKEHVRFLFSGRGTCYLTDGLPACGDFCHLLSSSAIHEFPDDIFTSQERKSGAVLLHIMAVRAFFCLFLFKYINTSFIRSSPIARSRTVQLNKPSSLSLSNVSLHFLKNPQHSYSRHVSPVPLSEAT